MYCYFNINNAPLMVVLGLLVQIHQTFRSWNPQSIPHHSWTKPSADMVEVFMKQQWKMSNNFWRSSVYFLHFCPTGWCIFRWVHDWNSFNCMSAVISWGGLGVYSFWRSKHVFTILDADNFRASRFTYETGCFKCWDI